MHKRTKKRSALRRRELLLALAVMLTLALVIGGTVAFLIDATDPVHNVFEPTDVTCYVREDFNGTVKKDVCIQNTGNIPAKIRVIVSYNYVNGKGQICAAHTPPTLPAPGSNWSYSDGYYYYSKPVDPGYCTEELFAGDVSLNSQTTDGCVLQMIISAEAIQAAGGASDKVW